MKAIEAVGHRVIVAMDKVEKVSAGGIVIVDTAVEREQVGSESGTVIAVGPDAWFDKRSLWAKAGDHVLIAKYAGKQVDGAEYGYPDQKLRIINDEDVLAIERPVRESAQESQQALAA